jgi:HAD superfamily hydrolase (TIGR01459 family)
VTGILTLPSLIPHFSALAQGYDVLLSDVWGVVHNGMEAFAPSCEALTRMRARGAAVILITNAPRPSEAVTRQLDRLHVPREAYDGIVSSGDVTRNVITARPGQSLYHLGPERDRTIFTGLAVEFAPLQSADYVVCSGLENDEVETPDDYRTRLESMLARKLLMVCGNPDVVVERGPDLVYCAGALADLYATMGGEVLYAGKPYRPIYELALAKAQSSLGRAVDLRRVLAIGDSVRTDLKGAHALGVDFLFITAGIHAEELGGRESPDAAALSGVFAATGQMPKAVMRQLLW